LGARHIQLKYLLATQSNRLPHGFAPLVASDVKSVKFAGLFWYGEGQVVYGSCVSDMYPLSLWRLGEAMQAEPAPDLLVVNKLTQPFALFLWRCVEARACAHERLPQHRTYG
jgi:hypothetical protein